MKKKMSFRTSNHPIVSKFWRFGYLVYNNIEFRKCKGFSTLFDSEGTTGDAVLAVSALFVLEGGTKTISEWQAVVDAVKGDETWTSDENILLKFGPKCHALTLAD